MIREDQQAMLRGMQAAQRFGLVIRVKPEKLTEYKRLHAAPWPGVLEQIGRSKIQNYTIFLAELEAQKHYLFAYYEYVGDDWEADMQRMAQDEETLRWWKLTDACQEPLASGAHWLPMEEVFHCTGAAAAGQQENG